MGAYPAELATIFGPAWPEFADSDLARIHSSSSPRFRFLSRAKPARVQGDFIGVNYYSRGIVRADPRAQPLGAIRVRPAGAPCTTMGWEVYPQGLTETLLWLKDRYGNPPLYLTENGAAFDDPPPVDGLVLDPERVDYLRSHLRAARAALELGVDLRGYFVWSLLDNFEWAQGYAKRFGLIQVDPLTQARTLKTSAHFYREVIRDHGVNLSGRPED